jgi:2-amino-4-hydroxy-6-hydroxymethyldihydropteridine diphosphokinase
MNPRHEACLLVGSNIQPETNLARGLDLLRQKVEILRLSSVWQSASVGAPGPDFLNLALLVVSPLPLDKLKLEILRPIEARLGRLHGLDKNAPRPLDLDIVIFDGRLVDLELYQYAYRAVPVSEVMPSFIDAGRSLEKVAAELVKTMPLRLKPDLLVHS